METFHVGIDIGKLTFVASIKVAKKYQCKIFDNNNNGFKGLCDWLQRYLHEQYHCCMESTGKYGDNLALFLHNKGCLVSIVNPAKIKYFIRSQLKRTKTDNVDAKSIRDYCEMFNLSVWKPLNTEIQVLQVLMKRLDTLSNMLLQEQNRLENVSSIIKNSIDNNIAHLKCQIKDIETRIEMHINNNPGLKKNSELLKSIPGIGNKTTGKILAFLSHIENLASAKQAAAFVGLNPQHVQSGTSINYSHISKTGDAELRKALYMPALVAIQREPNIKCFYEKLVSKGKPKKVAVCAVMMLISV